MTISTIPDFFVVKIFQFVEIVEISVNFDHDHLMKKWYYGHGQNGHFDHRPFGEFEVSKVMIMVGPPPSYNLD